MRQTVFIPAHRNPFRSERVEALTYRETDLTPADIIATCRLAHHGRGALTGPKGSGKTTLLLEIARALETQGKTPLLIRLNETNRHIDWQALREQTPLCSALLVDGAEQLGLISWWRRRWLVRGVPLLIITTHGSGRLPTLHRHRTTPELLTALVDELLADVPAGMVIPSRDALPSLFNHHGGDIRQCLRALYDQV
ncbi:MAG TPA: hypothetical protein DCS43_11610 [Verrucomicrobia bacterium]|nr:hypothetical protein [Verrucomicrobiota bacterium]